jgi:hypothetical protein
MTALETEQAFGEKAIPTTPCERVRITNSRIQFLPELEPEEIIPTYRTPTRISNKVFGTFFVSTVIALATGIDTFVEQTLHDPSQEPLFIVAVCSGLTSASTLAYVALLHVKNWYEQRQK